MSFILLLSDHLPSRVVTETGTRGFVKAIGKAGFEGAYKLYKRESDILAALPAGGNIPRLLGALEVDGWIVLVIQDVAGHHPATLTEALAVLDALLELPEASAVKNLPDAAADVELPFSRWKDVQPFSRWKDVQPNFRGMTDWARANLPQLQHLALGAADAISGDQLVHADLRPDSVLIDSNAQAWIVDWPWAVRGAQWFDALLFLLDCELRLEGINTDHILSTHPIFSEVREEQLDSVLAGFAGYHVYAAELPAHGVPQTLRDYQFECARAILDRMKRRSVAAMAPKPVTTM